MVNLIDALDDVLTRVSRGESAETCLARYPDDAPDLSELVKTAQALQQVTRPALSKDVLTTRRAQFLATARTYRRQAASAHPFRRFVASLGQPVRVTALARVAIAFVLVLSIAGGTLAATLSSLPDSPLYGLKLTAEDARFSLTHDPAQQAMLALAFANERVRELQGLAAARRPISTQVSLRLQNQLDAALSAAARVPEREMLQVLTQVRATAQTQEPVLMQAQLDAPREASAQDALRLAEQAMAQAQQQAESGLADPEAFRNQYHHSQGAPVQPTLPPQQNITRPSSTPEALATATTTPQPELTQTVQPTGTREASITPQRNQTGTGQPPTSAPGPQATVTPGQVGPGPQPTPGPSGPGPQPTAGPGDGADSGGGTGGGTRRP